MEASGTVLQKLGQLVAHRGVAGQVQLVPVGRYMGSTWTHVSMVYCRSFSMTKKTELQMVSAIALILDDTQRQTIDAANSSYLSMITLFATLLSNSKPHHLPVTDQK